MSLLVHALFFYYAPHVTLFDTPAVPRPILHQYKVQLESRARTESISSKLERETAELTSRPGSISDLLDREDETEAELEEDGVPESAPVPDLSERVAEETVERAYDLEQDPENLERMDERILEITEDTARDNIQVARRLVRPSIDRILPREATPALRGEDRPGSGMPLPLVAPPYTPDGSQTDTAEPLVQLERPEFEEDIVTLDIAEAERIEPPLEEMVTRAPIEREIQEVQDTRDYEVIDDLVAFKLDAYAPPGESLGYFRLRILPRDNAAIDPLPKDVTFVIDASKSISQHKLNATADGVGRAIEQLRPVDYFNVVLFRDAPQPFRTEAVQATPLNKAEARQFLQNVESEGETDVYKAIHPVIQKPPRPGVPGVVVLVSDGRPTTGMRDGRTIINGLTSDNNLRNSIFAFAGGRTVNRYLLDLLAYRNKGESYVVDDINDIPEHLPRFFERYEAPLLIGLEADFGRINETSVYPRVIPDFYRGRPVTIYGRYDRLKDGDFVVRLTGNAGGLPKEVVFRANLKEADTGDRSIARNWAFEKSYNVIGQMVTEGETPQLLQELKALSLRYNIRTSYTE